MDSLSSTFWYLLSSRSAITSWRSRDTHSQQGAPGPHTLGLCSGNAGELHLDDVPEVFALDVVVGLDEDLPQDGLADGIVFGVEFVKAVESVSVLQKQYKTTGIRTWAHIWTFWVRK